jgi:hypothetical protein
VTARIRLTTKDLRGMDRPTLLRLAARLAGDPALETVLDALGVPPAPKPGGANDYPAVPSTVSGVLIYAPDYTVPGVREAVARHADANEPPDRPYFHRRP